VRGLSSRDRLIDIGNDVIRVLDADRKPYIPLGTSDLSY